MLLGGRECLGKDSNRKEYLIFTAKVAFHQFTKFFSSLDVFSYSQFLWKETRISLDLVTPPCDYTLIL